MASSNGLRRSLADFKRHPWLHLMSISTISIALLIIGVFFLGYQNYKTAAQDSQSNVVGTIYLSNDIGNEQLQLLRDQVLSLENVRGVTYKSEKEILEELGDFIGRNQSLALPEGKIFPNILEVEVDRNVDPLAVTTLKTIISNSPFVTDIDFSDAWFSQFQKFAKTLKIIGMLSILAILVGCSFLIANFMGMRLQTRKEEIDIIRLMGADKRFVLIPFLWEGLIEGLIGSFLAIVLLYGFKAVIAVLYSTHWTGIFGLDQIYFLSMFQVMGVLGIGITMAFLGSVTIFLRVREAA